jgi:hypothetical protein
MYKPHIKKSSIFKPVLGLFSEIKAINLANSEKAEKVSVFSKEIK